MKEIQKTGYICHPQQMCTVRRMTVAEGKAKGTEIIEICTADGLQVDILPDTGLDIGQVRYKGCNVTFISKNGYDSPAAINPYELEFLNHWEYMEDLLQYIKSFDFEIVTTMDFVNRCYPK